jgi:hypothetical protein
MERFLEASRHGRYGISLSPAESTLIWSLAWSPDGERLAVGLADGGLVMWNVPKIQAELTRIGLAWRAGPTRSLQGPQLSPPQNLLARDGTPRVQ